MIRHFARSILIILGTVMSDHNQNRSECRGPALTQLSGTGAAGHFRDRIAASPRAFFC